MHRLKISFILILFLNSFYISATNGEVSYKLDSNQKIVGTYSGDINKKISVHLIIYKDRTSKKHGIKPFYIDEKGEILQFDEINFEKQPSIVSYHLNKNNLVLLVKESLKKTERLNILSINIKTKEVNSKAIENFENPNLIFRLKNKTLLITKEDEFLLTKEVENAKNIRDIETPIESKYESSFNDFFDTTLDAINTNEYVKNGSVKDTKAYYSNNTLIFDTSKNGIRTLILDLSKNTIKFNRVDVNVKDYKDINSFIHNNKLFVFGNNKKDINIKAFDVTTGNKLFESNLLADLSNQFDNEDINRLIKKSSRKAFKVTGTVNETVEDNMVINIDYVDTRTYNYNYNWWWNHTWFQQQMMWQQQLQQIQNRMNNTNTMRGSFSGSVTDYITSSVVNRSLLIENKKSIKVVLNKNFEVVKNANAESKFKEIDVDKYIDAIKKNTKLKHVTMSFTDSTSRYIFYSKKTKTFTVKVSDLLE